MEFFINKGATLPILKMQVVKDGIADYEEFMSLIGDSAIYFSMRDVNTGAYKILNAKAGFTDKIFVDKNNNKPEYYLFYKFKESNTNRPGLYEGEFVLRDDTGVQVLPIANKLFIRVGESHVRN
jgi:hypothetical protein